MRGRPAGPMLMLSSTDADLREGATLSESRWSYFELIEALGVPVYATNATGLITFYNDAAAELWGRRPELGKDRWDGAWRLYWPDGTPLPLDQTPMAATLREDQPMRGQAAIAERPDGTRVPFVPLPTPLRDASGALVGAVNVLIEITDQTRIEGALRRAEEQYRSIFENAVFGVFQTTPDGHFLKANEALARILGYDSADDLMTSVTDIAHQIHTNPERRTEFVERLSAEGSVTGFEARARRKDGSSIWLSLSGRVLRDDALTVVGYEGIVEDVTERKHSEEELVRLLASEQEARADAEASQQRLWFLAEVGTILNASLDLEATLERVVRTSVPWLAECCVVHLFATNEEPARAAVAHVNESKEELVRELHRRYPPQPGEEHPIIKMMETEASVLVADIDDEQVRRIAHDDGHIRLLEQLDFRSYMAVPLIARSRLFGAMTFARSESGRRYEQQDLALAELLARRAALALDNARLYRESQTIQEALRVANESKDEFLGLVSHELRTPITAIYGGARMLRLRGERLDDETRASLLSDIEGESERLSRMVENLLVLARLDLGEEIVTEPVLVQRVIEKVTTSIRQRRPNRRLDTEVEKDLAPVAAQPVYLEQVLRNLLANADKYCPPDSAIEIRAIHSGDIVEVVVMDRGPGIIPEEADRIFERFYRSESTAHRAGGSGMGLTVCKRLIATLSGEIWAQPREGGGLEIGFRLPGYKEDT